MTQKEFSEKLYVTESAVSKWERGMSYPDITLLLDICATLDVTEHELLTATRSAGSTAGSAAPRCPPCLPRRRPICTMVALCVLFGSSLLMLPVFLRQVPLPESLQRCKASLYTGTQSVLLLLMLTACLAQGSSGMKQWPVVMFSVILALNVLAPLPVIPLVSFSEGLQRPSAQPPAPPVRSAPAGRYSIPRSARISPSTRCCCWSCWLSPQRSGSSP